MNSKVKLYIALALFLSSLSLSAQQKNNFLFISDSTEILKEIEKAFENKRILLLGEASHGDGTTFTKKIELIKYLQKKLDIAAVVIEVPFIYLDIATNNYKDSGDFAEYLKEKDFFYINWSKAQEFQPLLKYVEQDSIDFVGFDCRHFSNPYNEIIIDSLKHYFGDTFECLKSDSFNEILTLLLEKEYESPKLIEDSQKEDFLKNLDLIIESFSKKELSFYEKKWLQELISIKGSALNSWYQNEFKSWAINNYRDEYMAKNIEWIANEMYPGKKLIIWAANVHIGTNLGNSNDNQFYGFEGMGDWVEKMFPNETLKIGFSSYEGKTKRIQDKGKPYNIKYSKKSLETKLSSNNVALINLNQFKGVSFNTNLLSYPSKKKWSDVFDYMYFIKQMYPATKIAQNTQKP